MMMWLRKQVGRFMLHVPVDSMELGELPELEERVMLIESRLDALLAVAEMLDPDPNRNGMPVEKHEPG